MITDNKISLAHGNGGIKTEELVKKIFAKNFSNPILDELGDSAIIPWTDKNLAISTDSFVIQPTKFKGGDIGKLAVCGTVNDLAVAGAEPLYLTAGFILEEGLDIGELKGYVESMAQTARQAGVKIVTGDTKVVRKGECDKLYINTCGIGKIKEENTHISKGSLISPGDKILISGYIGDHGMAIYTDRFPDNIKSSISSDCACLNGLISKLLESCQGIKFMRDPTRGGVAGILNEVCSFSGHGIRIEEKDLPIREEVIGLCELLGFDPLYLANEGKVVIIASPDSADRILEECRAHPLGKNAAIIGEVDRELNSRIIMTTLYGGKRIIDPLVSDQLPRIC